MRSSLLAAAPAMVALALAPLGSALAWGCEGHQIVALVAERHLSAHALQVARRVLEQGPIDPNLKRFCKPGALDALADAATWADDYRSVARDTAGWHFLDIPRGATDANLGQYCPASGCVTSAITAQLAVLRAPGATPEAQGNALRFVIHFLGDLHQPLHTTTNDDRGGNCVPVQYFGQVPHVRSATTGEYSPNLHAVWDTNIIARMTRGTAVGDVAAALDQQFRSQAPAWQQAGIDLQAWAWESHERAEDIAYGKLIRKVAIEAPRPVADCNGDGGIAARMLRLHEVLGPEYEAAAEPVIREQLAKAGVRLAMVLNDLWPANDGSQ